MLRKCLHLFTALGCLQTICVLCQSSELADTWSESCAVTLAQRCVSRLTVSALSYHPWWVRWGKQHTANLLCISGLHQPCQESPLAVAWAQPRPACVAGNAWGKDEMAPAGDAIWQSWGCCVGKEVQPAVMGVLLSEPTSFVEIAQQKLGAVVRWMLEAHCVLHYPSLKVLCSF